MTPVYLRNVQLLTYRIYVYFVLGTVMLLVRCVFTQLWPMNVMMGLFISLTFKMFCSVHFMWLNTMNTFGFMMQAVLHSFPYSTLSPVEWENWGDGLCTGQACIPAEHLSRNNDRFVSTIQECHEFFQNTCK